MVIKIEDGSVLTFQQATGGEVLKDSKNQTITFSQIGSSSRYEATVALNDGTGRNQTFWFDKPDSTIVVRRTVA
jgi:hypothetical protein